MLARASAHTPRSADLGGGGSAHPLGMAFVRYLDVCLVLASAPIVLLAKLPTLGYVIGAAGWIVTRFAVEVIKRRAWNAGNTRSRAALHLTAILGRVWLIAVVVLAARFGGHNDDGITAAVVVLVAFTVELAMSFILRGEIVTAPRRPS